MINKVSKFERVSIEEFLPIYVDLYKRARRVANGIAEDNADIDILYEEEEIKKLALEHLNSIALPKRSTKGSAGHDFYCPFKLDLQPGESIVIPTGIKVWMEEGWVLSIYPRSSYGIPYNMKLTTTVDIIDQDYYNNEKNEGHIYIYITNESKDTVLEIDEGERFCQGIFYQFGTTIDDNTTTVRTGGSGSTNIIES